mmetsp:Transcript_91573/g.162974  ORF Transcript_91573/g.162974 Transcript_91573/m.162974 type:complete len:231 (-) Transcript_91573:575-1267(-)
MPSCIRSKCETVSTACASTFWRSATALPNKPAMFFRTSSEVSFLVKVLCFCAKATGRLPGSVSYGGVASLSCGSWLPPSFSWLPAASIGGEVIQGFLRARGFLAPAAVCVLNTGGADEGRLWAALDAVPPPLLPYDMHDREPRLGTGRALGVSPFLAFSCRRCHARMALALFNRSRSCMAIVTCEACCSQASAKKLRCSAREDLACSGFAGSHLSISAVISAVSSPQVSA